MTRPIIKYKTVIISDVHLGTPDCKINEIVHFLKHIECEKLILNGDIVDLWHLKWALRWRRKHTHLIRLILKKIEKQGTEVVYLRGNHDDALDHFLPIEIDKLKFVNEHIHETPKGKYLIIHGDGLDLVTTYYKWLAILGAVGYVTLLRINRYYNKYRKLRGKEYFSLSRKVKAGVKRKVNLISNFEAELEKIAKRNECDGVICGHIHIPEDKMVGDIHYLNSGDWVESLTALVEEDDGTINILEYQDFCADLKKAGIEETHWDVLDSADLYPEELKSILK
jgi:UDP-2,3-diacylglucosamine pyrophosphatase LpxH